MIGVGSPARARREGGQSPAVAGPRRCSPPTQGPRRSIDIAGGGKTETSQNSLGRGLQEERDRGSAMANRPLDDRRGNCQPLPPHQMPLDNRWMSRVGWARKTVGRCRFDVDFSYIYHGLRGSASPVLTATGFVNGRWQFSTPTESTPLDRSLKNLLLVIMSATPTAVPNLVQIRPRGASGQMGEI